MSSFTSSSRAQLAAFAAACAFVFALTAAASEWLVRAHAIPQDSMTKHVALFEQTQSPYVAFGDSHVARGFDARPPVVNLAYPSENIEKMFWKGRRYLARGGAPKTVLLQADPHLFAAYRTDAGLGGYPELFGDAPTRGLRAFNAYYRPQLIALWQSYLKNGGRLRSTVETTAQGALLSPGDLSAWGDLLKEQFTRNRVTLHRPRDGFESSSAAQTYRDLVDAFVARGASVCLVSMPLSPVYRQTVAALPASDKRQWDAADRFFEELAEGAHVTYHDHRDLYTDLSLFRDPDHLNKAGAQRYGEVLQNACFGDAGSQGKTTIADL